MKTKILAPIFFTLLFATSSALAEAGKVTISSPNDGAIFSASDDIKVDYDAIPGPNGDHLHLNVDEHRVDVIHQLKGTADAGSLPAGKHHICLAVNTKSHVPTGVESCIDVTIK
jgi:hypothetical protein